MRSSLDSPFAFFVLLGLFFLGASSLRSAIPPPESLENLKATVSCLPESTAAEKAKNAVLGVALERAGRALSAGKTEMAEALVADVNAGLELDAEEMARVNAKAEHVMALAPVAVRESNPYLDSLVERKRGELATPETAWPRATTEWISADFSKTRETRDAAENMRDAIWLYANDASPLKGDPEMLKRFLRRAHAFIDAYGAAGSAGSEIFDQFAIEHAISGLCEFMTLYPGLLLPGQRATWDRALRKTGERLWSGKDRRKSMKTAEAWNLNIETAQMVAVLSLGYFTGHGEMVDKVRTHVDRVISLMKPDGGFPYHGMGNPACNYHNVLLESLTRIYGLSGYEPIRKALADTQWKGPVMGRTDEFWTTPFYKAYRWNTAMGTEAGVEAVVALSGNGYVRALLDRDKLRNGRDQIEWYRNDIKPIPLPDNYTIPDRNVGGPRAWYGNFTYAGSFRPTPPNEGGPNTLMGAMTVDGPDGRVNSILMSVTPRARILPADVTDANGDIVDSAWAQLSTEMTGAACIGKQYSACSAAYTLACRRLRASLGTVSDWRTEQIWIGLPDRIVGLVTMRPTKEGASAYELAGVLRLISGGTTGALVPKKLERVSENAYRYGQLEITIHSSNYAGHEERVVDYRREQYPATELTLTATGTVGAKHESKSYPADTCLSFVVEVRPSWAGGPATVSTASPENGILALCVTAGTRTIQVLYNPGQDAKTCSAPVDLPKGVRTSVRFSHMESASAPQPLLPAKVELQPGAEAVYVASDDPQDREPGWTSFEQMANSHLPAPSK